MKRKQLSRQRSFTVLVLTVVVFSLGLLVGNLITGEKVDAVVGITQDLQTQTLSTEIQFDILQENICSSESSLFLVDDLYNLGSRLDFMENQLGYDDPTIIELKEQYFIVQAKHWLLAKQRVDNCLTEAPKMNETIVLYFYSNRGDCPRCQQQGAVISYLREQYEGMKVYSFDITSESPIVETLRRINGLTTEPLPALVINEEPLQGFIDADEFIGVVRNQQPVNNTPINETVLGDAQGNVFMQFSES